MLQLMHDFNIIQYTQVSLVREVPNRRVHGYQINYYHYTYYEMGKQCSLINNIRWIRISVNSKNSIKIKLQPVPPSMASAHSRFGYQG